MNPWTVSMVTAFGRGENLALALHDKGFNVNVYDLTAAFPFEYRRGTGPFPIPKQNFLGPHNTFLEASEELPKGLVLWLKDGPVEFGGAMAHFFVERFESFRLAVQNQSHSAFSSDWMRRFLRHWISPYHHEPWQSDQGSQFPVAREQCLVPRLREETAMGFDRFHNKEIYHKCHRLLDVQIEAGRLTEMEIDTGTPADGVSASGGSLAVRAPQWVWCLSSQETEFLNPQVAEAIFSSDIRRAEWLWMSLQGRCERGPWNDGFPKYCVAVNDVHLPWSYANLFMLEWLDKDQFQVWLKVPAEGVRDASKRTGWAAEVEQILNTRLSIAKWRIDPLAFAVCPHSLVFPDFMREWKEPGWKNWDWIAPETTARLDLGARFERETESYQRLLAWRNDQMKKQGARGDQALHAP